MPDILITRNRFGQAVVSGESVQGVRWINKHMQLDMFENAKTGVTISAEHVDEFERIIISADLTVDIFG